MDLMGIGEFTRLSRLSPKALRLYDELELLPPAPRRPGLRIPLVRLRAAEPGVSGASLRQIGVPLAQIKVVLRLNAPEGAAGRRLVDRPVHDLPRRGNSDSDGPVEWRWPAPDDQGAEIGARLPDLTLRTEPADREAYIHLGQPHPAGAAEQPIDALYGWAVE